METPKTERNDNGDVRRDLSETGECGGDWDPDLRPRHPWTGGQRKTLGRETRTSGGGGRREKDRTGVPRRVGTRQEGTGSGPKWYLDHGTSARKGQGCGEKSIDHRGHGDVRLGIVESGVRLGMDRHFRKGRLVVGHKYWCRTRSTPKGSLRWGNCTR